MEFIKTIKRNYLAPATLQLGLDKLIRSFSDKSILNLMYHGVTLKDATDFSARNITADQFEKQMAYFKREFDVISLKKAFNLVRNNIKPDKKTITISFDDGYQNNLTVALPILEKYKIPATIFISGVCLEEEDYILFPDIFAGLLYFHKDKIDHIKKNILSHTNGLSSELPLLLILKSCEYGQRDEIINKITSDLNLWSDLEKIPDENYKLLKRSEITELAKSELVDIGSHGYLHYDLTKVNENNAKQDLTHSKKILEECLQAKIEMLAFPYGSYNKRIQKIAEQIGYDKLLALDYMYNADMNDHHILNRHAISSTTSFSSNTISVNLAFSSKGIRIK